MLQQIGSTIGNFVSGAIRNASMLYSGRQSVRLFISSTLSDIASQVANKTTPAEAIGFIVSSMQTKLSPQLEASVASLANLSQSVMALVRSNLVAIEGDLTMLVSNITQQAQNVIGSAKKLIEGASSGAFDLRQTLIGLGLNAIKKAVKLPDNAVEQFVGKLVDLAKTKLGNISSQIAGIVNVTFSQLGISDSFIAQVMIQLVVPTVNAIEGEFDTLITGVGEDITTIADTILGGEYQLTTLPQTVFAELKEKLATRFDAFYTAVMAELTEAV